MAKNRKRPSERPAQPREGPFAMYNATQKPRHCSEETMPVARLGSWRESHSHTQDEVDLRDCAHQ